MLASVVFVTVSSSVGSWMSSREYADRATNTGSMIRFGNGIVWVRRNYGCACRCVGLGSDLRRNVHQMNVSGVAEVEFVSGESLA